jgi:hypothetical protein
MAKPWEQMTEPEKIEELRRDVVRIFAGLQLGHFQPIDEVYAMSAHPPTAVELSQRSEPPLRTMNGLTRCNKVGAVSKSAVRRAVGRAEPWHPSSRACRSLR